MSEPALSMTLHSKRREYLPGEILAGEYRVDALGNAEPEAVEVSVLWQTEGKGDEDLAVHYFERLSAEEGDALDLRGPRYFSTTLPASPLSYEGVLIKIRWHVRVRVFFKRARELVVDQPFRLGIIPSARAILPAEMRRPGLPPIQQASVAEAPEAAHDD